MKKYYLKLSGTTVLQSMMYDGPTGLSGYTEIEESVYKDIIDNTKVYTYADGVLTSADREPLIDP